MGAGLSATQVGQYDADGVLFPIPALEQGELIRFRAGFDAVSSRLGDDRRPERFGQWHLCFPWAFDLAMHPAILNAIEPLLGPDLLIHSTTVFAKAPHSLDFVSWHQDGYNWDLEVPRLASAWVALTESTPENGCLRVIPGSHRWSRVEHVMGRQPHNLLGTGLSVAAKVDESQAIDVRLEAGDLSLHHADIVHGSGPNRSDRPRIGFAIRFASPDVTQRRPHHDVVLARGTDRRGHFSHRITPPENSIEDGLLAQEILARRSAHLPSSRRSEK